ncbi:MAG: Eco57I restriction-modification methylase domain-containing protein [Candidatus Hermodarchaeota archaeon]
MDHISRLYNFRDMVVKFYLKYITIYNKLEESLKNRFPETLEANKDFISSFLDRIIFLAFLEKIPGFPKGVFLLPSSEESNHFHMLLLPLFFWVRTPHNFGQGLVVNNLDLSDFFARIPFLSANLFPPQLFERKNITYQFNSDTAPPQLNITCPLIFSNDELKDIFRLLGHPSGRMDSRFLLTTSEYSEEDRINPEILGYIFEQGLDQNALGAFYTPKNVTSRMIRSALTNWLWQNMSEKQKQILEAELNFKFQEFPQAVCAEKLEHLLYNIEDYESGERLRTKLQAFFAEKLEQIKIVDPSCGSGAFLIVMFNEIMRLYQFFEEQTGKDEETTQTQQLKLYKHALFVIQNNLFGVDVLPQAIEKTALRLWLAVALLCPSIELMQPFPNLDFRLLAGNSIVGVSHSLKTKQQLFSEIDIQLLTKLEKEFRFQGNIELKNQILNKLKEKMDGYNRILAKLALEGQNSIFSEIRATFIDIVSNLKEKHQLVSKRIEVLYSRIRGIKNFASLEDNDWDEAFRFLNIPFSYTNLLVNLSKDEKIFMETELQHNKHDKEYGLALRFLLAMSPFQWDLYFHAGLFPPDRFDIVITNPPYGGARKEAPRKSTMSWFNNIERIFLKGLQQLGYYKLLFQAWDLALPFVENAFHLCNSQGIISMILPKSIGTHSYSKLLSEKIKENNQAIKLSYFNPNVFLFQRIDLENKRIVNVGIQSVILDLANDYRVDSRYLVVRYDKPNLSPKLREAEIRTDHALGLKPLMAQNLQGLSLKYFCCIIKGMKVTANADDPQIRGTFRKQDLISTKKIEPYLMPFFEAQHINRWCLTGSLWLEWGTPRCPGQLHRPRHSAFFQGEYFVTPLSSSKPHWALVNNQQMRTSELVVMFKLWQNWNFNKNQGYLTEPSINRLLYELESNKENLNLPNISNKVKLMSSYFTSYSLMAILSSNYLERWRRILKRSFGKFEVGQWKEIKIPFLYPSEAGILDRAMRALVTNHEQFVQMIYANHQEFINTNKDPQFSRTLGKILDFMWETPYTDDNLEFEKKMNDMLNDTPTPRKELMENQFKDFYYKIWRNESLTKSLIDLYEEIEKIVEKSYQRPEVEIFWTITFESQSIPKRGLDYFYKLRYVLSKQEREKFYHQFSRYNKNKGLSSVKGTELISQEVSKLRNIFRRLENNQSIVKHQNLINEFISWLNTDFTAN